MKPYAHRTAMGDEKVFNYHISRARHIVENAFGILCAKFRILLRTIELDIENAMQVVRSCLALHNFLMMKQDGVYNSPGFMDAEDELGNFKPGAWRNHVDDSSVTNTRSHQRGRCSTLPARYVCDILREYFFFEGAINFQWAMTE